MSRKNGGIIGPANTPVGGLITGVAGGVWRMNDVVNFVSNSQWPSTPQSIDNSCRFDDGSSDYLSFTPSSAPTSSRIATLSFWFKLSSISTNFNLFSANQSGLSNPASFKILLRDGNGRLELQQDDGSAGNDFSLRTNQLFRDSSAWYHLVAAYDTTQGTASNRIKLYINGSQITSFSQENYPTQNLDLWLGDTDAHNVGRDVAYSSSYYDGYMAEFVYIDGQQLTPSSFGETDTATGIWKPKKIGQIANAGTNSFYLNFKDSSNLGNDASGLNNDFTVNNLTSIDQSTDTCVENFSTMNPLVNAAGSTFSEGDLKVATVQSNAALDMSTFGLTKGKWYWEVKATTLSTGSSASERNMVGITKTIPTVSGYDGSMLALGVGLRGNGYIAGVIGSGASGWNTYVQGDIISVALDLDNGKLYFATNGTYGSSSNPSTASNGYSFTVGTDTYFPAVNVRETSESGTWEVNFGNPSFSISSGNADSNGYGNFEYAVPSGYYALNTSNLNTYG